MAGKEYWILSEYYIDKGDLEAQMEKANSEGWELEQFTASNDRFLIAVMVRSKEEPKPEPEKPVDVVLRESRLVECYNSDCGMYDEDEFWTALPYCPECGEKVYDL